MKLNFAPDFQRMFRPHTADELAASEQQILNDPTGDRRQVVVWVNAPKPNTVIDGHHTLDICKKNGLEPIYIKLYFDTRQEAERYALLSQLGRRNLAGHDLEIAAAKLSRALQICSALEAGKQGVSARSAVKKAAKNTGVSEQTIWNTRRVQDKGAKAIVDGMETGTFAPSDAATVVDLPKSEQTKIAHKAERDGTTLKRARGGTSFEPSELEQQATQIKRTRSGKPVISRKHRTEAQKHLGGLIRALKDLDLYDEFVQALNQIAKRLKQI